MFRNLGRATYEQDANRIRPLVMERGRLTRDAAASASTIYINSLPRNAGAYSGWVAIDPFTTECEIKRINAQAGKKLTLSSALTYAHTKYDEVMFLDAPVCNVKLFGAKGDDSTNDYTAISRALTQANTLEHGVVYLPLGVYRIGTGLVLGDGVQVVGDSVWNTELKATADIVMMTVDTGDSGGLRNFRVENIRFNGNSAASIGLFVGAAPLSTFRNLDIAGCTGTKGIGVAMDFSQNQTWDCVRSTGNEYNWYIINGSANCAFVNCHGTAATVQNLVLTRDATSPFVGPATSPSGHGFYTCIFETGVGTGTTVKQAYLVYATRILFSKCNFTRYGSATVPCVDMDATADQITFIGCRINSNSAASVDMVHADGEDINFEHCFFTDLSGSTTLVQTADSNALVHFNSIIPTDGNFDTVSGGYIHKQASTGWINLPRVETVFISGGTATITRSYVALAGEGTAADTLTNISGGRVGDLVIFQAASGTVDITIADSGNINLDAAGTIVLTNTLMKIAFQQNAAGDWDEYFRAAN